MILYKLITYLNNLNLENKYEIESRIINIYF